jgi:ABC-type multidrug transport system fused ATPase/permease subunit
MLKNPFWKSMGVLLRFKRQMALAMVGALISASCFGVGMSMMLPTIKLLGIGAAPVSPSGSATPRMEAFIREQLIVPDYHPAVRDAGQWLITNLPHDEFQVFVLIMVTIAVLSIIGSTGRYIHELFTLTVIYRAMMRWREQMLRRVIAAPMIELLRTGTSDVISRINSDAQVLSNGYRAVLGKAVGELLKGAAVIIAAFVINWKLSAVAIIGAPVIGILLRKFGKRIRRATRRALSARGRMLGVLKESLDSINVVKVHNAEGFERRRFAQVNRDLYRHEMTARQARALASPLIDSLAIIGAMVIACIAAWLIFRQGEDPAEFITVLGLLIAASPSLKLLANLNNQIAEAGAAAERIYAVLQMPVEPLGRDDEPDKPNLTRHQRDIIFDAVSFAYPDQERPAVNDVDLRVPFGHTVAIVGGNGSGKTTLVSLLPRLIDPSVGAIRIDGSDIQRVNLRSLREQFAVVSQQSVLFQGTIAENIAYGRRWESRPRIVAAAKAAHADDFVRSLPEGYDTKLGEGGTGLSGGQRQRLCIARAILRDPAILILDEATSQIDTDSETKINDAIRGLRHGRTIFVIAHRMSTVVDADMIVVMHEGSIVDRGTHDALLERCAMYRTLAHNQFGVKPK